MSAAIPIAVVHGAAAAGEKAGLIALALLAAAAVLLRPPLVSERARAGTMLATLVLTPVLLVIDIWHTSPMEHLRAHPALASGAGVAGLVVIAALAVLFTRRPQAFPLLAVFALPFRLPISTGSTSADLLVPLYLVVAGAVLAHVWPRLLGRAGIAQHVLPSSSPIKTSEHASGRRLPAWLAPLARPFVVEALLMGFVVLYAVQAVYSTDFSKALQNAAFFYVPFALLLALLREVRWTRRLLIACGAVAVGLAVVFAGVGFVEYQRKALFLNPKIVAAHVYDSYFRVNSVFFDPNIYGRFLALVMILVATVVLWPRRRRDVWLAALALAWLWAGLISSFSQSSMVALIAGLVVLAGWRWSWPWTVGVSAAAAAAAAVLLFAAPSSLHFGVKGDGGSLNTATSGRLKLVKGGTELFLDRPIAGYGSGSFAPEYRAHLSATTASATSASHTTPVTIAAEQGVIGLVFYVALMLCALFTLFTAAGRSPPAVAIAACFTALAVHTLAYADFLEDPVTWTLLGVGLALAASRRARAAEPAPAAAQASPAAS